MDRFYGNLLPRDIVLELSLYLNYRDIWQLCQFYPNICFSPDLWINKINKELRYSIEFIKQYVYDITTKQKKTLLPLNEKYMELKSRNNVDFGSEYYKSNDYLFYKASRIKDYKLAMDLMKYLIKYLNRLSYMVYSDVLRIAITGAISVGNIDLANYLLKLRHMNVNNAIFGVLSSDAPDIVEGYYEASVSIREKINLTDFNIDADYIEGNKQYVILGLTAGNHLEELKKFDSHIRSTYNVLNAMSQIAFMSGSIDVIKYYDLLQYRRQTPTLASRGVQYGTLLGADQPALIANGYLELIDFSQLETEDVENLKTAYMNALHYNHIDTNDALYNMDEELYSKNIFRYNPSVGWIYLLPETYQFIKRMYPHFKLTDYDLSRIQMYHNEDLLAYLKEINII